MPRILITGFCSFPGPDRAGVQLRHVVRALGRHHDVDVLCVRRGEQAYVERFGRARVLRVPVSGGSLEECVQTFRRALRRQIGGSDYDVVHCRDGWSGVAALELKAAHDFALVFDAARSPLTEPPLADLAASTELERSEMTCVRHADMVLAPSEFARHFLGGLADPDLVHTVPPGVDVDAFDWDDAPDDERPRILYLGGLAPGRGVRVLLRAMLDVIGTTDAELVLAGCAATDFERALVRAIEDLKLSRHVRLLGEIEHADVPAIIATAHVCVAPGGLDVESRPTALYPTALLEYMACQRVVVAPRRTAITMMLRDGQHGLLFEPGEPSDLAEKILALLADRALRSRLARAGYELVRRVHTASGTRRELLRAYRWLISQELWSETFAAHGASRAAGYAAAGEISAQTPGEPRIAMAPAPGFGDYLTGSKGFEVADDVTRVEANPIGADPEYAAAEAGVSTGEWMLSGDGPLDGGASPPARGQVSPSAVVRSSRSDASVPVDSSFVAGELEVPELRPDQARAAVPVTAVLAPPGSVKIGREEDLDDDDDDSLTDVAQRSLRDSGESASAGTVGYARPAAAVSEAKTRLIERETLDQAETLRSPRSKKKLDPVRPDESGPAGGPPVPEPDPKKTLRIPFSPEVSKQSSQAEPSTGATGRRDSVAERDGD